MRSSGATSGSAFRAAVATGDAKVFLLRVAGLGVVVEIVRRLGVFSESAGVEVVREVEVEGLVFSFDGGALRGDLKGVLKGERKGLESVVDAASIRRRLAAGVDILILLVLFGCKLSINRCEQLLG